MPITNGSCYRAIMLAVEVGREIQVKYPWIDVDLREGVNRRIIASSIGLGHSDNVNIQALHFALYGNNNPHYGPTYSGFVKDEEELARLRKKNRVRLCTDIGNRAVERKSGVHAMSREELVDAACKATLAKGQVPWEIEEKTYAAYLRYCESYKYKDIANKLNERLYCGERIRTKSSVIMMLRDEEFKRKEKMRGWELNRI